MLVRMSEEDPDYEGKWPDGDAMSERVLVPREPTAKMVLAAFDAITNASGEGMIRARWRCMLDAAPAAPQMTDAEMIRTEAWQSITDELAHAAYLRGIDEGKRQATAPQQAGQFDHLAGRGIHELRTGELPAYIVSLAVGHGPSSPVVKAALDWIVSELERKTNDERALAVKLDAIRTAPQQAEPVGYFVNDESDDQWHQVDYEQRNGADTYPLYLHPPADEVQRLRDALRVILEADWTSDRIRNIARKALEGGE